MLYSRSYIVVACKCKREEVTDFEAGGSSTEMAGSWYFKYAACCHTHMGSATSEEVFQWFIRGKQGPQILASYTLELLVRCEGLQGEPSKENQRQIMEFLESHVISIQPFPYMESWGITGNFSNSI